MFARDAKFQCRPTQRVALSWLGWSLSLGIALLLAPAGFPKEGMDPNVRIDIIRGLLREVGVTKIPMPRGKKGVRIDEQGNVDKAEAEKELRSNGTAMQPGVPAQITKIEFKSDQVTFELNGGGKSSKKWYQHIEVGMGVPIAPVTTNQPQAAVFGSSVTVDFGRPLPNLTVPQMKKILTGVLDFERHSPTVLYSPNVSPAVKEAIKNHQVIVGMDRDAVLSARGAPDRRVREDKDGAEKEDWIYGLPPHVLYVTFESDIVVEVKQY